MLRKESENSKQNFKTDNPPRVVDPAKENSPRSKKILREHKIEVGKNLACQLWRPRKKGIHEVRNCPYCMKEMRDSHLILEQGTK